MSLSLPGHNRILFSFYLCKISKVKIFSIVVDFYYNLLGLIHQRYIDIFHVQTSIQCTQIYKTVESEIKFDENYFLQDISESEFKSQLYSIIFYTSIRSNILGVVYSCSILSYIYNSVIRCANNVLPQKVYTKYILFGTSFLISLRTTHFPF